MSARKLNLNNYEPCTNEEEADIIIVPLEKNGIQPKNLLFKKKNKGEFDVTAEKIRSGKAIWYPAVKISQKGTPNEYNECIRWWFNNATDEYRTLINRTYSRYKDIEYEVSKAMGWLLTNSSVVTRNGKFPKRKNDINKFLNNWLSKNEPFIKG